MKTSALALCTLALAALLTPVSKAAADGVVIAGGERGRTYNDVYAANLSTALRAFKPTLRLTQGSGENLDLLADGKADVGFAQLDVYRSRLRSDASRYGKIEIIGHLTDECVFFAVRKVGRLEEPKQLQTTFGEAKPLLAVGASGSGAHETWRIVTELQPAYGATAVRFTEGTLSINHLATGMLDAVMWVTDPTNTDHKLRRATRANEELALVGLNDPTLVSDDGYHAAELPVGDDERLSTICTRTMIFNRPGINPRVIGAASDALSLDREKLLGK